MNVYWTKGMRVDDKSHAGSWASILSRRLLMDWDYEQAGSRTSESENKLGIGPHSYFYVDTFFPDFGKRVVVYEVKGDASAGAAEDAGFAVTPFDTGAFASDLIPFTAEITDKHDFLSANSFGIDYSTRFAKWIDRAYSGRTVDYVEHMQPSHHYCAEIDVAESARVRTGCDERCWTWEARIPKREPSADRRDDSPAGDDGPLSIKGVWMNRNDLENMVHYILNTRFSEKDETNKMIRKTLYKRLRSNVRLTDGQDAVQLALVWLKGNV